MVSYVNPAELTAPCASATGGPPPSFYGGGRALGLPGGRRRPRKLELSGAPWLARDDAIWLLRSKAKKKKEPKKKQEEEERVAALVCVISAAIITVAA